MISDAVRIGSATRRLTIYDCDSPGAYIRVERNGDAARIPPPLAVYGVLRLDAAFSGPLGLVLAVTKLKRLHPKHDQG